MDDLISRAAAIDAICGCFNIMEAQGVDMTVARAIVKSALDNAPAVDAAPVVHGRWVKVEAHVWTCSICGVEDCFAYDWSEEKRHIFLEDLFCPHCGAKMDGGDNDGKTT